VIVVIGSLRLRGSGTEADAAGLAASIAIAAANEGARVELIGKVGNDPAGDAVLLALSRQQVGHVAILRDPARRTTVVEQPDDEAIDADSGDPTSGADQAASPDPTAFEAADAGLALRYLPEVAVIVAVHLAPDVLGEAISAAGWADTSMVVVVGEGQEPPADLPGSAVTLAANDLDDSGVGPAIGRYVAALDRGVPADAAYATLLAASA
jgi:sugar/nucleoside kinase (ribokinase family)